jgi:iron complex outermembrane receptor protein
MKNLKLWGLLTAIMTMALVLGPGRPAKASETVKLNEVVVSASKTDRRLVDTPASITIITSDEIGESGASSIAEIVENIPGVIKDSDSRDRLTFRGNRGPQSSGALILVDGIPVNSGISGYSEYDAIAVSDIERIEVIRSSASIKYGPDAARGVVNVITKKGDTAKPRFKANTAYGSWETWKSAVSVRGQTADWDYTLGGSLLDTEGYEKDHKKRGAARGAVGYNLSDNTRLGVNLSWHKLDYDTIYGKTRWQVDNYRREKIFPTSETNPTLVHHRENEDENVATSLELRHQGAESFFNAFVSYDNTDHVYKYLPKRLDPDYNKSSSYYNYLEDREQDRYLARVSGGYHFTFGKTDYSPAFGADYETIEFDQKKTYPWSPSPLSASQQTSVDKGTLDTKRQRWGLFLSNELSFGDRWEINLDGRLDRIDYDVRNAEPEKVTKDHTDLSWNITPAFHPVTDATVYASVSRSYWYPVLQYYKYAMEYGDERNPAEDLKPEEYLTWEIGYKHYLDPKLSMALTAYYMEVRDKFLSLYDESDWKGYRNVGKSKHQGIELEMEGRLCPYFGYRFLGAYQKARWDEATLKAYIWGQTPAEDSRQDVDISDEYVPHVPEFKSSLGLDFYFFNHFQLSTDVNYYGKQYIDVLNRYEISDYMTVDARISYRKSNYKIWVLANNIFDREVENKFNETGQRNADGSPSHLYYPLDGRYLEIGATIDF